VTADPVRAIADAVLYEGYVLWPYRRSALKNQQRWTFGGVFPAAHAAARPDDRATMQTQCLLEGDEATRLEVRVRFLHIVERQAMAAGASGLVPVDELVVGAERHLTWDEAAEREIVAGPVGLATLETPLEADIAVPAGEQVEAVADAGGSAAGAVVRRWHELAGRVHVAADRVEQGLYRISVRIENATGWTGDGREDALRQTFCSTHTVLRAGGGAFVSLTDPPEHRRDAAAACENDGTWPVLVGEEGDRDTLLSSPIILSDHPRIAPESPGDLFDGGEIDQMLVLNILSLTEEERREMRDADPRTREILERTEALTEEEIMRLHGAIREVGLVRR
jgi:hypothetical protein